MRLLFAGLWVVGFATVGFADEATDRLAKELVGVMKDPRLDVPQRVQAAKTLAKLGPQAGVVVPDLISQLKRLRGDELEPLQQAVIETLAAIGSASKPALPTLAATAGRTIDLDLAVKRATTQILNADDTQDLKALMEQITSRDVGLRLRAAKTLGSLGDAAEVAVPALKLALSDPDGDVRRAAVSALRRIQPQETPSKELIQAIVADLNDPDDGVRLLAVRSLGQLGKAAVNAIPAIEPLLNDSDKDVRRAASDALLRIAAP